MKSRRRDRGFSLLESMIAMAVIAIAIFAVISMTVTSLANKEAVRELQTAKEAAASKVEEFKARGFASLAATYPSAATPYTVNFAVNDLTSLASGKPGALMTVKIDVSNPDLYDILATIDWKGRNGKSTYSIRSLCAR